MLKFKGRPCVLEAVLAMMMTIGYQFQLKKLLCVLNYQSICTIDEFVLKEWLSHAILLKRFTCLDASYLGTIGTGGIILPWKDNIMYRVDPKNLKHLSLLVLEYYIVKNCKNIQMTK